MPSSETFRKIRIFVACPSDVSDEKDRLAKVVESLQWDAARSGFVLEMLEWRQCVPDLGLTQEIIFEQLSPAEWDIFIGILWTRLGVPSGIFEPETNRELTGTEAELLQAIHLHAMHARPRVLIYRSIRAPKTLKDLQGQQLDAVERFCKDCEKGGKHPALIKEYEQPDEFERLVNEHLRKELAAHSKDVSPFSIEINQRENTLKDLQIEKYRETVRQRHRYLDFTAVATDQSAYRNVELHEVFIPQDARSCQDWLPANADVPKELVRSSVGYSDENVRRFVALRELTAFRLQAPRNTASILRDPAQRCLVIIGDPGAGKTSLTLYQLVSWLYAPISSTDPVPIRIELRHWHRRGGRGDFLHYLADNPELTFRFPREALRAALDSGYVELIFDGLDEIFETEARSHALNQILRLSIEFPRARFVVTSRPAGYPSDLLRGSDFLHWRLEDFDDQKIRHFVNAWCNLALRDPRDSERVREQVEAALQVPAIRDMAGNPLLLTMMVTLARSAILPRDQATLYEKSADLLLERWDTRRALGQYPDLREVDIDTKDKQLILRRTAWHMQNVKRELRGNLVPRPELEGIIGETLIARVLDEGRRRRVSRTLIDQLRERDFILCHLGDEFFSFVHRGFLEYFCALDLKMRFESERIINEEALSDVFASCADDDAWHEILALTASMLAPSVADRVLRHLAEKVSLTHSTTLRFLVQVMRRARAREDLVETSAVLLPRVYRCAVSATGKYSIHNDFRALCVWALPELSKSDEVRECLEILAERRLHPLVRRRALAALADHWPDNRSWAIVERVVRNERDLGVRLEAMATLAVHWSGILTSEALARTMGKEEDSVLEMWAAFWPDEHTRDALERLIRSEQGSNSEVEAKAIEILAKHWKDERTRRLFEELVRSHANSWIRFNLLRGLSEFPVDEKTRDILEKIANTETDFVVLDIAIKQLAHEWPDERTRSVLEHRFKSGKDQDKAVQRFILSVLATKWPDEEKRALLEAAVKDGESGAPLQTLVQTWHDERTRSLLADLATNRNVNVLEIVTTLGKLWRDDQTRLMLERLAEQSIGSIPWSAAVEALVDGWPNETTQALLKKLATTRKGKTALRELIRSRGWAHENQWTRFIEIAALLF